MFNRKSIQAYKSKVFSSKIFLFFSALFLFVLGTFLFSIVVYSLVFWGKIFPGVKIANLEVGGLSPEEAIDLSSKNLIFPNLMLLTFQGETYSIPTKEIDLDYDYQKSVQSAYSLYRTGNTLLDIYERLRSSFTKPEVGLLFSFNQDKLNKHLSVISGQVSFDVVYPSVEIIEDKILVLNGSFGQELDVNQLRILIDKNLAFSTSGAIEIPIVTSDPTINSTQAEMLRLRAKSLLDKSLVLSYENLEFEYKDKDIIKLLDVNTRYKNEEIAKLFDQISEEVEREPQNSIFIFEEGKVREFAPALDGISIVEEEFTSLITKHLDLLELGSETVTTIKIPVQTKSPEVSTEEVNNLGIKELLGRGTSKFIGSITSRIHNIGVAADNFNGILVSPGETFSFNDILGDVSAYTGYKQAYIIKDGKTILGDGGGVCQVSTTLFRAALNAGLPIAERRAHSYRVTYYEQGSPPGIDATVYAPTTDLKIVNDTPAHILIQTKFDRNKATLDFEIYGTNDERIATTTKPVVTNVAPPPEDLYTDDPTKPVGYVEQIDWKAWGAKVSFDYIVKRGGEIIYEKTFSSNFKPWQAKFLRGTSPVN